MQKKKDHRQRKEISNLARVSAYSFLLFYYIYNLIEYKLVIEYVYNT